MIFYSSLYGKKTLQIKASLITFFVVKNHGWFIWFMTVYFGKGVIDIGIKQGTLIAIKEGSIRKILKPTIYSKNQMHINKNVFHHLFKYKNIKKK